MGWGQQPSEVRAAEEARVEAERLADRRLELEAKAHERRPMSAFESKLIGVLEDIRDRLPGDPLPSAQLTRGATREQQRIINDWWRDNWVDPLGLLLDSPPAVLTRSVQAAGLALANAFPAFRDDLTAAGFEKFAEVAIEAALHEAARDKVAEVDRRPLRVDIDLEVAPATPRTIAGRVWRGPGLYVLSSTADEAQVYAMHLGDLADMIGKHPVRPQTSEVQQGAEEEAGGGEPAEGPSSATPEIVGDKQYRARLGLPPSDT